ncbi:MAG: TraB/GumN family protein [Thiomargarita sp.]|nr:TraB/GumN family protein [Thiomargarita sp.]
MINKLFKHFSLLILCTFFSIQLVFADNNLEQKGLFWQIENGKQSPSYLFGTIHSEDPRVNNLPKIIDSRFKQADSASFEILMDISTMLKASSSMFFVGENQSLEKLLEASLYQQVITAMKPYKMPKEIVNRIKPWAITVTLSSPPIKTGEFLDFSLYQQAIALNIPVYGLETVKEQLDIFNNISIADQVQLLKDTIKDIEKMPAMFEKLHELYLARDLTKLFEFSMAEMKQGSSDIELIEDFIEKILDKRNIKMVKRMEERLQAGNAFIAVGALHLPGEQGILKLLQNKGYKVSPLY